jgi:ABC-type transport system involved in multi-copper enzyme maturation permease subunit
MPKIAAVSLATAKSEMAQPLFLICMLFGFFIVTLSLILPYNTFGEDIKMHKDTGLQWIIFFSILPCVWAASNSLAEEIEGRTALTVLSKPIGRRQFILGKFSGIVWLAAVIVLLLGLWFLITVAYKPLYDARETANVDPDWHVCYDEMAQSAPGLALGFFETIVLASISVAVSTRLPMLANVITCMSIYALGHLTPMLVKSSMNQGAFEAVVFIARLLATVLPVFENFDIKPAIAGGVEVPWVYLGTALVYCILYCTVAMLLALTLFEDRDLA